MRPKPWSFTLPGNLFLLALALMILGVGFPSNVIVAATPNAGLRTNREPAARKGFAAADTQPAGKHPKNETRMSDRPMEGFLPSAVWRVRGSNNVAYVAGMPDAVPASQVPFPSPYYAAYRDSQELLIAFDTDLSFFSQLRLTTKLMKWIKSHQAEFSYPKGRTMADSLSARTIERLRVFYGKDFPKKERMTPAMLAFFGQMETSDARNEGGIEDFFAGSARKDRKPIRIVETTPPVDAVLALMDEMLVKLTHDIARRGADAVIEEKIFGDRKDSEDAAWRRGTPAVMVSLQEQMKKEMPSLYTKQVVEGNPKWLEKLKIALRGKKNVMALLDLTSLGGQQGLLQMLREAGFTVEQMHGTD